MATSSVRHFMTSLAAGGMLAAGALAPSPAQAQAEPQGRWQVDWGEQFCSLARIETPGVPVTMAFRITPGMKAGDIVLLGEEWDGRPFADGAPAEVTLGPTGTRFDLTALVGRTSAGARMVVLQSVDDEEFLPALEQATEVRLSRPGSDQAFVIPVPSAESAVRAVRQCIDGVLRQWGVDPDATAALREEPELLGGRPWINPGDYPQEALRAATSGRVIIRLTVDTAGRVSECTILSSSGSAVLDSTTCRLARDRARYSPAIGPDGQAVAVPRITAITWRVVG